MTTRIRVENPRDNKHAINVWKSHEQSDDHVAQLPPGDSIVTHIWDGMDLTIKEVPNSASVST